MPGHSRRLNLARVRRRPRQRRQALEGVGDLGALAVGDRLISVRSPCAPSCASAFTTAGFETPSRCAMSPIDSMTARGGAHVNAYCLAH
jgi:hypothetical protein